MRVRPALRLARSAATGLLVAWLTASTAKAQVTACEPSSADVQLTLGAVRAWGSAVAAATPGSDPTGLVSGYEDLFQQPCARMASEVNRPEMTTVLSMQQWLSAGGYSWLWSLPSNENTLTVPPGVPAELTLESAEADDPLRSLLCSAADESCGRATAGWRMRAAQAFREIGRSSQQNLEANIAERRAECLEQAKAEPEPARYAHWSRCAQHAVPQQPALPLGATSAPDRGWFVLRGRRGHYSYCEELRAYHLPTGAAYVVKDCGRIVFQPHSGGAGSGSVVGRLPVEALREAAWMTLFARRVAWQTRAATIEVPSPLTRSLPPPSGVLHGSGGGWGWGSSAQTLLSWAWVDGTETLASGTLTWPDSMYPGEDHADELWRVAEAALEPGCAPVRLPRRLALGPNRSGVSPVDATPDQRRPVETTLEARLRGLGRGDCRQRRRR